MSALVALPVAQEAWVVPTGKPLDEAVWQAWLAKGRAQNRRSHAAFMNVVKWVSLAALLAAAGNWPHPVPYDVVVRFVVSMGAIASIPEAYRARHYIVAAALGALVLLYNPVAPLFDFAGGWQRAGVLASCLPFFASLVCSDERTKPHND